MAEVTAKLVKELREMTGAGMMDCKKALVEADGDLDKAVEVLREKGLSKAAKKAGRIAAMGLVRVALSEDGKTAAIVEVNSETDFVAKNDEFIGFVEGLAKLALEAKDNDIEAFKAMPFEGATAGEALTAKIAKIGENMSIRRIDKASGEVLATYIHGGGNIGVIVAANGKDSDENKDIKDCSVMVQPFVTAYQLDDYLIQAGVTIKQWCDTHKRTAGDNRPQGASSTYVNNGNNYIWGFAASSASSGGNLSTDSWLAGDPYGVEIARIDLPKGYIFGSSAPNSDTLVSASDKAVNFDPEDFEPKPSPGRVQVSAMRPSGSTYSPKSIGTVDASMLDDKNH